MQDNRQLQKFQVNIFIKNNSFIPKYLISKL